MGARRGQRGPQRENRLEPFGRTLRHAEAHLDPAQQEEPFDPLLLIGGPDPFQEHPRVLQPAGPDEEPAGLHPGEGVRRRVRLRTGVRMRARHYQTCNGERGRSRDGRKVGQPALLLLASEPALEHHATGVLR